MEMLHATKMSRSLKALCDVNRIRILEILVKGEFCVSELVEQLQIDQPKVSHHLAILRSAGIIRSRRDGRHINYSIRPTVYSRMENPDGATDVFDLGELTVTFRFGAVARMEDGTETPSVAAPAPVPGATASVQENGESLGSSAAG
ncbi:MAG: ArsR/SmtB family transcription factor [Planctomycetota bacterium]|jgi:ArsR family transcriptional regulator